MTRKTRRNLMVMRKTDPEFRATERAVRAQCPHLSEYDAAREALTWLSQGEYAGEVLAKANPGLTQVQ